jgi:hypothetical protein
MTTIRSGRSGDIYPEISNKPLGLNHGLDLARTNSAVGLLGCGVFYSLTALDSLLRARTADQARVVELKKIPC